MNADAPTRHSDRVLAFEAALQHLLPGHEHERLLAACLLDGGEAAHAWRDFVRLVHDPKVHFEADQGGLKGLLPFVEAGLTRNGIDPGKAFHTYARVARVREELRSRIYGEILGSVLVAFGSAGISNVLLKGGALSATVYPQPSTRHNHAIDLLVEPQATRSAHNELTKAGFSLREPVSGAACHQTFRHTTGLALGLHTTAFYLPHFDMPLAQVLTRTRPIELDGGHTRVMSTEDSLVHVCGHTAYSRARPNLRWACDLVYLLQANTALDWQVVTATAKQSRVALPMLVLLRWVNTTLMARVPPKVFLELREGAAPMDTITMEGLFAALLLTGAPRRSLLRHFAGSPRVQLDFLRFNVFPPARYMRWKHNVNEHWKLAFYYADRPRRLVRHLLRRRALSAAEPEDTIGVGKEGRVA